MSPCFCLPWPESIEVKQEYPYILSYNHYYKYIFRGDKKYQNVTL